MFEQIAGHSLRAITSGSTRVQNRAAVFVNAKPRRKKPGDQRLAKQC
jgi:hypothetical protein